MARDFAPEKKKQRVFNEYVELIFHGNHNDDENGTWRRGRKGDGEEGGGGERKEMAIKVAEGAEEGEVSEAKYVGQTTNGNRDGADGAKKFE